MDKQAISDEQVLANIYRQINQAMLDKNTETIGKLTTNDFTLTHITGYKQSKFEWLNHIETNKMQYHQIDEQSVMSE
ncbi:nuclear transport factor 2 family protein [Neisseria weixii]|nr:nuclear transport factor 2 family protein [Neisseria weixii]